MAMSTVVVISVAALVAAMVTLSVVMTEPVSGLVAATSTA
jgi:hypothetical protein